MRGSSQHPCLQLLLRPTTFVDNLTGYCRVAPPPNANTDGQQPSTISFHFYEDDGTVFAELSKSSNTSPLGKLQLELLLNQDGLNQYQYDDGVLDTLVTQIAKGEIGRFHIGNRTDAQIQLDISSDKLLATLNVIPAMGGKVISPSLLESTLSSNRVVSQCVKRATLTSLLKDLKENRAIQQLEIAQATAPKGGEPARFESLLKEGKDLLPKEDDSGVVDLKNLRDYITVEPGTPLMRRFPALEGKPGVNVIGGTTTLEPGTNLDFDLKLEGSELDASDSNLLISSIKGIPVVMPNGVKVDPVLSIKNVDHATGNVNFDGAILIGGNVTSGFSVECSGHIQVKGLVEHASLVSGGNIDIGGGVVGDSDASQPGEEFSASLKAAGDISAKFINSAYLEAAGNLSVKEYVLSSQVKILGELQLGQEGGKGRLLGGHTHAERGVIANILGSEAYVKTEITAGCDPLLQDTLEKLVSSHSRRDHESKQLKEILNGIIISGETEQVGKVVLAKSQKIEAAVSAIEQKVALLEAEISAIEARVESFNEVTVQGKKRVYPGVNVQVNNGLKQTNYECETESPALTIGNEE